jgi:hypothetical protein
MLDSQINDFNQFRNMVVQMEKCRAAKHTSNMICYSADVALWFTVMLPTTESRVSSRPLGLTIIEGRCWSVLKTTCRGKQRWVLGGQVKLQRMLTWAGRKGIIVAPSTLRLDN